MTPVNTAPIHDALEESKKALDEATGDTYLRDAVERLGVALELAVEIIERLQQSASAR